MNPPKQNLSASVRQKLLNLSEKRKEPFDLLLVRYGIERLLYRLSQSRHADKFLLKGAMLFALWDEKMHRPTRDTDLLSFGSTDLNAIQGVFQDILQTSVPDDGLVFQADSIQAEEIREDNAYGGIRVRLLATLIKTKIPLQIDLGFGDVVTPAAEMAVFPALLDFPAPEIRAYPIYTVVAEKFEAMVKLGSANTRMKDFYDLWFLSQRFDFDGAILQKAIQATFARRKTALGDELPFPLTDAFAKDVVKQDQWAGFLRRNALVGSLQEFADIVVVLRQFIEPVLHANKEANHWRPSAGWFP